MNPNPFWASGRFLGHTIVWSLVMSVVLFGIIKINISGSNKDRESDFYFKDFLIRGAIGQAVDEKIAWPQYVYALRSGQQIHEEIKNGKSFDAIIKQIKDTRADLERIADSQRENYKKYLENVYKTPRHYLYLAENTHWKEIEENPEELKTLAEILKGNEYKAGTLETARFTRRDLLMAVATVQFIVYLIATLCYFDQDDYKKITLRKTKLTVGAFVTFLMFSPGALPLITIQLLIITGCRFSEYREKRAETENAPLVSKKAEAGTESQHELLRKLQERVGGEG